MSETDITETYKDQTPYTKHCVHQHTQIHKKRLPCQFLQQSMWSREKYGGNRFHLYEVVDVGGGNQERL